MPVVLIGFIGGIADGLLVILVGIAPRSVSYVLLIEWLQQTTIEEGLAL